MVLSLCEGSKEMTVFKMKWVICEEDAGLTIKAFLKEHGISKTALTDIKFSGGSIIVNNKEENVRYILKSGDVLKVSFPQEKRSEGMIGENIPLNIVYEDEYVLVVNKPAGMSSIPSREHPTGSLANAIIGYFETIKLAATVHIVTRLDKDTSGLVLIAKHRHVHHLFSKLQQQSSVQRKYIAFAEGTLLDDQGVIEKPIARMPDSIIQREVNAAGKYACTHFLVLKRSGLFTVVQLKLETGRTHQIRVHLSSIGHPLIGDDLYGGSLELLQRQALHCSQLSFYHPFLKKLIELKQSLPEDMGQLLP